MADVPGPEMIFSTLDCVHVSLQSKGSRYPRLVDDKGFIRRFLDWCESQGYKILRGTVTMGPGIFVGDIEPASAKEAIEKWLKDAGATVPSD